MIKDINDWDPQASIHKG